jgi:hypothetical protein
MDLALNAAAMTSILRRRSSVREDKELQSAAQQTNFAWFLEG